MVGGAHYHGHRTQVLVSNRGVRLPRFLGERNLELSHLTLLKICYGQIRVTGKLCTFSLENAPNVASMSMSGDSGQPSRGLSGAWGRKLCPETGEPALLAQTTPISLHPEGSVPITWDVAFSA